MDPWRPAQPPNAAAVGLATRPQRCHYRHPVQRLTYLSLDQSNGGIIRNLGEAGIAIQAVAPLCANQQIFIRFDLGNPRVHVEATGRVAWADTAGQAGLEFLALPQRSRRLLKEWMFIQLLATAQQATEESNFSYGKSGEEASELLFSSNPRPAIHFEPAAALLAEEDEPQPHALNLPWFPSGISAHALSWLVDGLVLLSAVLLFAVICMTMIGIVPAWPITLVLALGVATIFTVVYRFLFLYLIGGTPGYCLARRTDDSFEGRNREAEDRPRFR
jgi:hypothetical protein